MNDPRSPNTQSKIPLPQIPLPTSQILTQSQPEPLKEKLKQIAAIKDEHGKLKAVGYTYDVENGQFALHWFITPYNIYRNNYQTIKKMVQHHYPSVIWLDHHYDIPTIQ